MSDGTVLEALLKTADQDEQVRRVAGLMRPSISLLISAHPAHGVQIVASSTDGGSVNLDIVKAILNNAQQIVANQEKENYARQYAEALMKRDQEPETKPDDN